MTPTSNFAPYISREWANPAMLRWHLKTFCLFGLGVLAAGNFPSTCFSSNYPGGLRPGRGTHEGIVAISDSVHCLSFFSFPRWSKRWPGPPISSPSHSWNDLNFILLQKHWRSGDTSTCRGRLGGIRKWVCINSRKRSHRDNFWLYGWIKCEKCRVFPHHRV